MSGVFTFLDEEFVPLRLLTGYKRGLVVKYDELF